MNELKNMFLDIGNVRLVGDQLTVKDAFLAVLGGLVLFFGLGSMAITVLPWWAWAFVMLFLMKGVYPAWETEVLNFGRAMMEAVPLYFVLVYAMEIIPEGLAAYFAIAGLVYMIVFVLRLVKKHLFK